MENKSQLPPFLIDIALYVILYRWKDAVVVPITEFYDEVTIYKNVDALLTNQPNTMIEIHVDDQRMIVTVDDSKDPLTADILENIRSFLKVSIGWDGPYPKDFAVVAQW